MQKAELVTVAHKRRLLEGMRRLARLLLAGSGAGVKANVNLCSVEKVKRLYF